MDQSSALQEKMLFSNQAEKKSVLKAMNDPALADLSDYQLIKKFRNGDALAFEALVLRHKQRTFRFIYHMVGNQQAADDLFQDLWLKVLKKAHTYQPKAKFSTWVFKVARNTVLDYFKRENLRSHVSLDLPVANDELSMKSLVPSKGPQPEEVLLSKEVLEQVHKAVRRLPIKQQEAFVFRVYQEMPYNEIAKILEAPEGTVKYWVHEAVKNLSNYLERGGIV